MARMMFFLPIHPWGHCVHVTMSAKTTSWRVRVPDAPNDPSNRLITFFRHMAAITLETLGAATCPTTREAAFLVSSLQSSGR